MSTRRCPKFSLAQQLLLQHLTGVAFFSGLQRTQNPACDAVPCCAMVCPGFEDHVSYGCADYRRTVATVLQQIDLDPTLLTDDRRVEVDLVHV